MDLASDAVCRAALEQAATSYGVRDAASWQAVLQHDAADFARCLCLALRADVPEPHTAAQWQRKPVMIDAGLQVQAVVAEASNHQQMRSVGSIVRPVVKQAAVQQPRSLATGVNVASHRPEQLPSDQSLSSPLRNVKIEGPWNLRSDGDCIAASW